MNFRLSGTSPDVTCCVLAKSYRSQDTYNADVSIDGGDFLVRIRFQQLAGKRLLKSQHYAVLATDSDGGAAVFSGLDGVFDLC
jgi:hypothetical protein